MVTDGGGVDALGSGDVHQIQLGTAAETVADLGPVHQVPAVEHRNAGKEFKGACHHVVILPHAADAGVRVEAGQNRVLIAHFWHLSLILLWNMSSSGEKETFYFALLTNYISIF